MEFLIYGGRQSSKQFHCSVNNAMESNMKYCASTWAGLINWGDHKRHSGGSGAETKIWRWSYPGEEATFTKSGGERKHGSLEKLQTFWSALFPLCLTMTLVSRSSKVLSIPSMRKLKLREFTEVISDRTGTRKLRSPDVQSDALAPCTSPCSYYICWFG